MKVLFATRSEPKVLEVRQILSGDPALADLQLLSLSDAGVEWTPEEEGIEAYDTFAENAAAKARWFASRVGMHTLADDSGLIVDGLGGLPGVRSRRFCPPEFRHPEESETEANNRYLLERLQGHREKDRRARFVCVAALASPGGSRVVTEAGVVEGEILDGPEGSGGFGYDPLFRALPSGLCFGHASKEAKGELSHRGSAFRAIVPHVLAIQAYLAPVQGENP
jgi:XTP/dITP diphosphohydrolase